MRALDFRRDATLTSPQRLRRGRRTSPSPSSPLWWWSRKKAPALCFVRI